MRERESPDRWSAAKASQVGNQGRFPIPPLIPGVRDVRKAATQASEPLPEVPPADTELAQKEPPGDLLPPVAMPIEDLAAGRTLAPPRLRRWATSWQFWVLLATVGSAGMAWIAVTLLLKLPSMPNCPSTFWPTASASVRLYCAEVSANKQTVKELLAAIALVRELPADHPLREEVNRHIKEWSEDILNLGEKSFHAGKLNEAIATARKIPTDVPAFGLVKKRIDRWRSTWSKAEVIYRNSEARLRELEWNEAFQEALRLLEVGNTYWETTKYEELTKLIEMSRDDGDKLAKARSLANRGGVKNLVEAIGLARSITPKSYIYQAAQKAIPEIGRKMLALAQYQTERQDLEEAIAIARQIPPIASLQAEVEDFINIVEAQIVAKEGTSASVEAAIARAQKISAERPLYNRAQRLIVGWQRELEDIARLEKARQLAQLGTVSDLTSAIAQAQLIRADRNRAEEARGEIERWTSQIQTMEDRPYLDRAEQLASASDEASLQAAVDEVGKIASGRALYREAQNKRQQWVGQIERIQDQPYLDRARELASGGDLPAAITVAQQIRPGRVLSSEAQAATSEWQAQIQAQQSWQEANRLAAVGTPEALAAAVRLAQQVPRSSPLRAEVQDAINLWSYQVLSMAQDRASYDVGGAVAIAQQVPSGTSAYSDARTQIESWQNSLNPPPTPSTPESEPQPSQLTSAPQSEPNAEPSANP